MKVDWWIALLALVLGMGLGMRISRLQLEPALQERDWKIGLLEKQMLEEPPYPPPSPPAWAPEGSYDDPEWQLGGAKTSFRIIDESGPAFAEMPGDMVIRIGGDTLLSR